MSPHKLACLLTLLPENQRVVIRVERDEETDESYLTACLVSEGAAIANRPSFGISVPVDSPGMFWSLLGGAIERTIKNVSHV